MLLQQGQGMHGRFGRDNTRNFMAATGPDFKAQYRDPMPASNAGITPTLLRLLGWQSRGPATDRRRSALEYQRYGGRVYLEQAALRVVLQQERTGCPRR